MKISACTITQQISKVCIKDPVIWAENILEILKPYATEFRKLGHQYGLIPEYAQYLSKNSVSIHFLDDCIKKIAQHPFVTWLNKQAGFAHAKSRISKENLVIMSEPDNEIIKSHRNLFVLEDICFLVIYHFSRVC